jgi:hypothetical protein
VTIGFVDRLTVAGKVTYLPARRRARRVAASAVGASAKEVKGKAEGKILGNAASIHAEMWNAGR